MDNFLPGKSTVPAPHTSLKTKKNKKQEKEKKKKIKDSRSIYKSILYNNHKLYNSSLISNHFNKSYENYINSYLFYTFMCHYISGHLFVILEAIEKFM